MIVILIQPRNSNSRKTQAVSITLITPSPIISQTPGYVPAFRGLIRMRGAGRLGRQ